MSESKVLYTIICISIMGYLTGYCECSERRSSKDSISSDLEYTPPNKEWPLWKKILIWSFIALLALAFLLFILIWIVIPIIFWLSIAFQRLMIFMPFNSPKNPDFDNPETYGIEGVLNFYIAVTDYHNPETVVKIGAWLILPEDDIGKVTSDNIPEIIRDTKYDIAIFLHGVLANRAKPILQYGVIRKDFMIIAVDHRGYGDSGSNVEMTEIGMVHDHLQIYDWIIHQNFKNDIYYWGHSMGCAISCHAVKLLKEQKNVVPKGLVLESAFTTLAEEVKNNVIGKIFKWLAYFNATVLYPLDYNGFQFYSSTNILSVDCPIMIMHAEDDNVIPSFLGKKLADIATTKRNVHKQGNVSFHLFPAKGYGHNDITRDPSVPQYIKDFKDVCQSFTKS